MDGLFSTVRRRRQWLNISANSRVVRPLTHLVCSILPPLIDRTGHTSHSSNDSNFDRVGVVQPTIFGWGSGYGIEISVAGLNDITDPWVIVSIGSSKAPY